MTEDPARLPGGPDYVRWVPRDYRAEPLPATAEAAGQKPPSITPPVPEADRLDRPQQDWWTEFGNEELNELIDTALINNYDLRAAVARIEQAENQARIADAAKVPNIQFFSGIESRGPAEGVGTAKSRKDWHSRGIYQFGLRANYEVDLWGKLGYEAQSALEQARASVFAREVVALTLVAETSIAYFQHLSFSERIAVAENNLKLAHDVAEAISRRLQRGDASKIEQQQQLIAISLIENNLANLKLERERVLTRLAVFLGKPPSMIQIRNQSMKSIRLPVVRPSLPSELLCRRPDIRRAEAQLAAASADVNAARANLLPSVALTGQFGQGSFKLTELLSPQSILYSLAGNLVADIFDGERKENRVTQARAHNRELLEQYAGAVLGALRDVEDALTGIRLTGLQQQALAEALARNAKLLEMSHTAFKLGAMDLISFLDVQRNVYQAQDSEASARLEQARSAVDLFKALGGGVSEQQSDPCATPVQVTANLKQGAPPVQPAKATSKAEKEAETAATQARKKEAEAASRAIKEAEAAGAQAQKETEAAAAQAKKEAEEATAQAKKKEAEAAAQAKKKAEAEAIQATKEVEESAAQAKKEAEATAQAKIEAAAAAAQARKKEAEAQAQAKKEAEAAATQAKKQAEAEAALASKQEAEAAAQAKREAEAAAAQAKKEAEAAAQAKREAEAAAAQARKKEAEAAAQAQKEAEAAAAQARKKEAETAAQAKREAEVAAAQAKKKEAEAAAVQAKKEAEAAARAKKEAEAAAQAKKEAEEATAQAKKEAEAAAAQAKKKEAEAAARRARIATEEPPAVSPEKRPKAPLRPAGRISSSAASEAAAAQAEKEAEAAARQSNGK